MGQIITKNNTTIDYENVIVLLSNSGAASVAGLYSNVIEFSTVNNITYYQVNLIIELSNLLSSDSGIITCNYPVQFQFNTGNILSTWTIDNQNGNYLFVNNLNSNGFNVNYNTHINGNINLYGTIKKL
jgi:hypothetical protein